jgi:hypothetical protein
VLAAGVLGEDSAANCGKVVLYHKRWRMEISFISIFGLAEVQ